MDQGSLRRVAVLLSSLDQSMAAGLLAKMPPSRAAQVRYAISQLSDVDPLERKMAIADFMQTSHAGSSPTHPPQSATVHNSDVFESNDAKTNAGSTEKPDDPLHFLSEIPIRALASALSEEHPQTVAIVLASMQPTTAAKLLADLPQAICKSSLQRLARITEIPGQALQEISTHLQSLVERVKPPENVTGSRSLASILTHLDASQRELILSDLANEFPNLALALPTDYEKETETSESDEDPIDVIAAMPRESVDLQDSFESSEIDSQSNIVAIDFAPVENLPADALRRVLAEVELGSAIMALCGMDPRVVQRLMTILPRNQSREIRDRLQHVRNLELRQIDEAQECVYSAALQMFEAGRLPEWKGPKTKNSKLSVAA